MLTALDTYRSLNPVVLTKINMPSSATKRAQVTAGGYLHKVAKMIAAGTVNATKRDSQLAGNAR